MDEHASGDIAYVPEGVERALRNPAGEGAPFVVVTQITPPQFDLYTDHGFYSVEAEVMNFDAISKACANSGRVALGDENEMAFHDSDADVRSWCLSRDDVRRDGALFNVMMGAPFTGIGLPMRLVLWPGAGCRTAGFNYAFAPDGITDVIHKHPVSDECLMLWSGQGWFFVGNRWVAAQAGDCALAPQGVVHGHRSDGDCRFGGFASPPQLDLLLPTDYYSAGRFLTPEAGRGSTSTALDVTGRKGSIDEQIRDRRPAAQLRALAGLGPDHLLAPGPDAEQRHGRADLLGDELEVLARGLG